MEGRSRCAIGRFGAALGMTPNANYATWHGQRREGGGVTASGARVPTSAICKAIYTAIYTVICKPATRATPS